MRMTYGQLLQASQDAVVDDSTNTATGLSSSQTFLKREINNTCSFLFSLLREYKLQPAPRTQVTAANTIYYNNFPGLIKIESATIDVGSITPPLIIVESQKEWDLLQQTPVASGYPTHIFPRRDDYGLYPTPGAVYTVSITGSYDHVNMTDDDLTGGTITTVLNDETIVGSTTTFTSARAGAWFALTTGTIPSSNWYRVASITDATNLELSRKWVDAAGASGLAFIIGQSPEVPAELHEFIPYRAAAQYYMLRRKDSKHAKELLNYFYTGDFDNPNRTGKTIKGGVLATLKDLQERGRDNSQLIEMNGGYNPYSYIRDGIWSVILTAP